MFKRTLQKPDGREMHLYGRSPVSNEIVATNPPHAPLTPNPQMRWHPLRGEWVTYASHRQDRTFLPPKEYSPLAVTKSPEFPTELPAGNYDVAVFENLFPSFAKTAGTSPELTVPTQGANGRCEVVVFTQDEDGSLGGLDVDHIELVLKVLGERTRELGKHPEIKYVLPFENRGVEVGVTLHHPHGQIYAYPVIPPIPQRMNEMEAAHFKAHGRTLLGDFVADEMRGRERSILTTDEELPTVKAFIPICARYPYETWIAPVRSVPYLYDLTAIELRELALTLKTVLTKFDSMWDKTFPYLMVIYQAPVDGLDHPESHTHIEFFPPYRTKDKLKYLAGTELGGGLFINDSWPEEKALDIRNVKTGVLT